MDLKGEAAPEEEGPDPEQEPGQDRTPQELPEGDNSKMTYSLNAEPGSYGIDGKPISTVVEGEPGNPIGRRVEYRPSTGGRSYSRTNESGDTSIELSGSLDVGRKNESAVQEILMAKLLQLGRDVRLPELAPKDEEGEDCLLVVDGREITIQIVSFPPDSKLWQTLSRNGEVSGAWTSRETVALIREAIERKSRSATGMVLALDATKCAAIIEPRVIQAYLASHGDPTEEFGLLAVWLVGPTPRSTRRLASDGTSG